MSVPTASLASAMEAVGFSAHERAVASTLAQHPGSTAGQVAKKTQLHRNQVYRALRRLENDDLLVVDGGRPQRFSLADGAALRRHFEQAFRRHEEAARTLMQAWHGLDDAPAPGFSRAVPAMLLDQEVEEFQARQVLAALDTWPLEFADLPAAPRQVTLPGRAEGEGVRHLATARPLRYLLAADACLLLEGPSPAPSAHVMESPAAVAAFEDHFRRVWQGAQPV